MQPVNDNRLQYQAIPAQPKISVHRETSHYSFEAPSRRNTPLLPEDVVHLSTDRSSLLDPAVKKEPSVPVSSAESKALRDSFSVYA